MRSVVVPPSRTQNSVLVGRGREMFTGSKMFTGTVTRFKNTGGSQDTHGTNIVHTRGERYTAHARARLARRCADRAAARRNDGARARYMCGCGFGGWCLRWCRGTLYWVGNRTERLKEKQRLTSCDGAQELHATWLLAMYAGRSERRQARRARGRVVGGQLLSRNAAQTINVLGFCRSAICRSS